MVKVYFLNIEEFNDTEYNLFYSNLSDFRKKKVDGFSLKKDKKLSCFGGALLSYVLKKDFNLNEKEIEYSVNEFGKPCIKNAKKICFNLSHSKNLVMLGISDNEIGVDIQEVKKINEKLINRFSDEEILLFDESCDKEDLFFRLWTIKESFIKYLGKGLSLPLKSFSVSVLPKVSVKGNDCAFMEFKEILGYKASVCYYNKIDKVVFINVSKNDILNKN